MEVNKQADTRTLTTCNNRIIEISASLYKLVAEVPPLLQSFLVSDTISISKALKSRN